jgi:hypothetical protein
MEAPNMRTDALDNLTDDTVVEILCCLPARSLFCCKLAYHSWDRLIKDSKYLKLLSQTVAGFFYDMDNRNQHFTSITSEPPSLEFLPFNMDNIADSD